MKYILDSSSGFKSLITETDSDKAKQLIEDYRNGVHDLIAPDIYPIEIAHALTKAERQGRVSTKDGYLLWSGMMTDCPRLLSSLPLMPKAYGFSSKARIGIYDCLYISLADEEQCQVVSADNRLITLFPQQVISLASL